MKRIILLLLILGITTPLWADNMLINTSYPTPMGLYDRIQLVPKAPAMTNPCEVGTMYMDKANNMLGICYDDGTGHNRGTWNFSNIGSPGDVDLDGAIDYTDAHIVKQLLNNETVRDFEGKIIPKTSPRADINGDGLVTLADADLMQSSASMILYDNATQLPFDPRTAVPSTALTVKRSSIRFIDTLIIATGTHGSGVSLESNTNANARFMWYPKKSSFRAGFAGNGEFQDSHHGEYSAGFGDATMAKGKYSFAAGMNGLANGEASFISSNSCLAELNGVAIGTRSFATGDNSVAIGMLNNYPVSAGRSGFSNYENNPKIVYDTTKGVESIAIGASNQVTGKASVAIGYFVFVDPDITKPRIDNNIISSDYSVGIGTFNQVSGIYSTAIGDQNTASGIASTALNYQAKATGNYSTAISTKNGTASGIASTLIGPALLAQGDYSTALGDNCSATANYSSCIGADSLASGLYSTAIGAFSTASGQYATSFGRSSVAAGNYSTTFGQNMTVSATGTYSVGINLDATARTITQANAMVIMGGNVGIGTLAPNAPLEVVGTAAKPGGGTWTNPSDIRFKKNVKTISGSLEKILNLRGVTYEWKDPKNHENLTGTQIGVIAQEVEKVMPEWVDTINDTKYFNPRGFEGFMVETMRELKNKVDSLKTEKDLLDKTYQQQNAQIEMQTKELDDLKTKINKLSL